MDAAPGQRPIALTDLTLHLQGVLNAAQCRLLIDEHRAREAEGRLEHSRDANSGADTVSTYTAIDLRKGTEAFSIVHDATEAMINCYHRHLDRFGAFHVLRRESMRYSHRYRLLRYGPGASVHPHTDHAPFVYGSCTFNLSNDYEGGRFSFLNGRHTVELGLGDAMIWPADYFWVHAVEPVTRGARYSANSFLQSVPEQVARQTLEFSRARLSEYNETPALHDGTFYAVDPD